ncbi:MAG: hypothetical protein WC523_07640 [Patescibacteria group bacterium]
MKRLVIISGITGAIGNALLAEYGKQKSTVIYGISRQALNLKNFVNPESNKFYLNTFVCSLKKTVAQNYERNYNEFFNLIDFDNFFEVIYIHALGVYPFEVNEKGKYIVEHDSDGDGVDDRCTFLSYNLFRFVTAKIIEKTTVPVHCAIFGGLADKHGPQAHKSWIYTINKTKEYMKNVANNRIHMLILNISSAICSHELITRPFVFINTNADHSCWLSPFEIGKKIVKEFRTKTGGYHEKDIFNHWAEFKPDYYQDRNFTPKKMAELFKK